MRPILDPQTRAIVTSGLIRPVDALFALGFSLEGLTLVYWHIFGSPSAQQMFVVLVATAIAIQAWILIVLLRLGVMILMVRADVNLMPEAAAKIASQLRVGGAPTDKKV